MRRSNWVGLIGLLLAMAAVEMLPAQNIGIGTRLPGHKLHVEVEASADGIRIDNVAANGDPILQYRINGSAKYTLGVDDSDEDRFKIGTTALTSETIMSFGQDRSIGIRTTEPGHFFHMTNGGETVGANSMASFDNSSPEGVALAGQTFQENNPNNAVEGVTYYNEGTSNPAGVFGLAFENYTVNNVATVGVAGHTNCWQGFGVVGSRRFDTGPDNGFGGQFYNDVGYTGNLYSISDQRTKQDIRPLSNALSIVNQLEPVSYHYDADRYPAMGLARGREFGFVAQDVARVLPEVTARKTFLTGAASERQPNAPQEMAAEEFVVMDYTRLIPILTQAIKEQQTTISELQREMETLRQEIKQLKSEK